MMKTLSLVAGLALILVSGAGAIEVIEFQQGVSPTADYAGTADAHIISWDGTENQLDRPPADTPQNTGGHDFIEEGDYNIEGGSDDSKVILIKFDISSIDASAANRMKNAEVGLYFAFERREGSDDPSAGLSNPHFLSTQRILKNWAEGDGGADSGVDGDDAPDNSGVVTWNSTGSELWEAIGAEGPTDVGPVESRTWFDPVPGTWLWLDVSQMAKSWIANPDANNGVKISQETDNDPTDDPAVYVGGAYNFASSENAQADDRPVLRVSLYEESTVGSEWSIYP